MMIKNSDAEEAQAAVLKELNQYVSSLKNSETVKNIYIVAL